MRTPDESSSHDVYGTPMRAAERHLILDAFDALRAMASVEGVLLDEAPPMRGRYRPDAVVELAYERGRKRYLIECKTMVDRKVLIDQVRSRFGDEDGLLIAPYISRELAEYCRAEGQQFLDTCGNAYLRAPGLFVFAVGQMNSERRPAARMPKGLTNAAGLRVVLVLLTKPEMINAPLQQIAEVAGVSVGAAHRVLVDLDGRGYLLNRGSAAKRRLLEPGPLIDEWAIIYPTTLRTKLHSQRFRAPDTSWWKAVQLQSVPDITWGGEVAAERMTKYLKPSTQTLYVPPQRMDAVVKMLVGHHRLRPDPAGEVEVLEKFWDAKLGTDQDVAPALLVYSELLAMLEPRTRETAHMIRERYIVPTFDSP
jgi:hypothetical protein